MPEDSLSVPIYSLLVPSSVSQIWPSTDSPSQMRSWDVQGQVYTIGFYKNCEALFSVNPRLEESEEKLPQNLSTKSWSTDGHLSADDGLREG